MDAVSSKSRRPVIIEFLATLFVTFCIGVGTSILLCACVILMAGEARGEEFMQAAHACRGTAPDAGADAARARVDELVMAHRFATHYPGLIALGRAPAPPAEPGCEVAAPRRGRGQPAAHGFRFDAFGPVPPVSELNTRGLSSGK